MDESILYDRSRLEIMTVLATSSDKMSFNELLQRTNLTKGNLSSHLKKLEDQKYVVMEKSFIGRIPLTTIIISRHGKEVFKSHLEGMQKLLKKISNK